MKIVIAPEALVGDPESNAMMQAFYSRSKRGIEDRLAETTLDTTKIKKALNQYYVGYGHDSIGQCGFTTIFIEDISIPAIKAIQDNDLFNGQENSTRYMDYATEPRVQVEGDYNQVYQEIMGAWIDLYSEIKADVQHALATKYSEDMLGTPPTDSYDPVQWTAEIAKFHKACQVKAFDIAGAFLPAGVLSNTSWTTSLATLNRELLRLVTHPLPEVRQIALEINRQVKERYPSVWKSFGDGSETENYYALNSTYAYSEQATTLGSDQILMAYHELQYHTQFAEMLPRPRYARLPRPLHESALITARVTMDYRSFRDVQRHRPLRPAIPLLGSNLPTMMSEYPISSWYIDCLISLGIWSKYDARVTELIKRVRRAPGTVQEKQYLYPMGHKVTFPMSGYLGDWLYFCELRSGDTVHPTVRHVATAIWAFVENHIPPSLLRILNPNVKPLDTDSMRPSFKRAAQDIIKKA